jgi:hypothetical protein
MYFIVLLYENLNMSSHLLIVLARITENLLLIIIEEFSHIISTFTSASKIALAALSSYRYTPS